MNLAQIPWTKSYMMEVYEREKLSVEEVFYFVTFGCQCVIIACL